MNTQAIRARLAARLGKAKSKWDIRRGLQLLVSTDDFSALTSEHCPPELAVLKSQAESKLPTHILMRPKQLELLLEYKEPKRNARANDPQLDPRKVAGETQRSKEAD